MTLRTSFLPALGTALAVLAAGCTEVPTDSPGELAGPQFAKGGGKGGSTVEWTSVGDIVGGPQTLPGKNTDRRITVTGDVTLVLNMDPLDCQPNLSDIPREEEMVARIQDEINKGRVVSYGLTYCKKFETGSPGWDVDIGDGFTYNMHTYGETTSREELSDRTVITYTDMAVMVNKMKGRETVSRERCSGSTSVDAVVTVSK